VYDSGEVRLTTIINIIRGCLYSIHDLSRTELDPVNKLPRFNMALELGIDLGARYFGPEAYQEKKCLILDSEPFRYQKFISDIAGQAPTSHNGDTEEAIRKISDWLRTDAKKNNIPGGTTIIHRYKSFLKELHEFCRLRHLKPKEITFIEYTKSVHAFLKRNPVPISKTR
jgi:hypothetical protein